MDEGRLPSYTFSVEIGGTRWGLGRKWTERVVLPVLVLGLTHGLAPQQAFSALIPPTENLLAPDSARSVRVRMEKNARLLSIRGFDLSVHDLLQGRELFRLDRTSRITLKCDRGEIYFSTPTSAPGRPSQIRFSQAISIRTHAGFMFLGERPFREEFRVSPGGRAQVGCDLINVVDLEIYLKGLINSEFSDKWSPESVAAQAIAARTYAYFQMNEARRNPEKTFDLESTVKDQVYDGSLKEDFRASRAVEATRGELLLLPAGKNALKPTPIKAFYHSTCGGKTVLPQTVWGVAQAGYTEAALCPYCKPSPAFSWQLDLGSEELRQLILKNFKQEGLPPGVGAMALTMVPRSNLLNVSTLQADSSGRAFQVELVFKEKPEFAAAQSTPIKSWKIHVPAATFRRWVGAGRLKSTAFQLTTRTLDLKSGEVKFRLSGRGNGHGVGMCQWGAKEMGARGFTRVAILKHYYPGALIQKMW